MEPRDMCKRARLLAASSAGDEQIKAAVNALAGAVERLEQDAWLLKVAEQNIDDRVEHAPEMAERFGISRSQARRVLALVDEPPTGAA